MVWSMTSLAYRCSIIVISLGIIVTVPLWLPIYLSFTFVSRAVSIVNRCLVMVRPLVLASPTPSLRYAVLKGTGKYMRTTDEQVFTHQLYDYTARKLMSQDCLQTGTTILEVECDDFTGLQHLRDTNSEVKVLGLQSNSTLFRFMDRGNVRMSTYTEPTEEKFHCILLFNLKAKLRNCGNPHGIDLIRIAEFFRGSLRDNGYIVFGEYLEEGEDDVLKSMFGACKLRVVVQEDIDRNIKYGQKLINEGKGYWEHILNDQIVGRAKRWLGLNLKSTGHFTVFLLEPDAS